MHLRMRLVFLTLAMVGAPWIRAQEFALHEGDRVAFYGDSITAQRLYTRFVEDFVLTRYPELHVTFWNAGVPGDTVYGGYTGDASIRLKRDLFPHRPTVVTVMLGMNDGYYMAFNQKYLDVFTDGYRKLLGAIESGAPAARVTLISPTPYEEVTHGTQFPHYNEVVSRNAAFVKEFAASSHLAFADFNRTETDLVNAGERKSPELAKLLVPDRIHPGEASHWVMAAALARGWGVSPDVSSVSLDALQGKATAIENAQVAGLTVKEGSVQWTQTDNALPLPLPLDDAMIRFVLGISNLADMDREMLRVDGLPAARYSLKIDGQTIASFTREECAGGVNLALYNTPMESQAKGVDGIELERTRLDEAHFILAVEDPKVAGDADATKTMEAKDAVLQAEQRKEAQPKPHRFELSPE
ncbi:MAG: SGNH/GDSL hydrolase family protein [Terracidiphilus sp.]